MKRCYTVTAIMVMALGLSAAARVVEIDFATVPCDSKGYMLPVTADGLTITPDKGSRTIGPQFYERYDGVVFYGTNKLTLNAGDEAVCRVEMTCSPILPLDQDKVMADNGAVFVQDLTSAYWTDNSAVGELTIVPRANTLDLGACLCTMKVYLTDAPAPAEHVATPSVFPYGGQIFSDTDIFISCATPGATVWYTVDGRIPEPGSDDTFRYDGSPVRLDSSGVICAIAEADGMAPSHAGACGFSVPVSAGSIEELLDKAEERIYYTVSCDLTVTCCLGSTCWITDGKDHISLFGDAVTNASPKSGAHLTQVTGRFNRNNGNPELEYVNGSRFAPVKGDRYEPREVHAAEITAADANHCLVVRGATVSPLGDYNYSLTDESATITIRNNYRIAIDETLFDRPFDVVLMPAIYNDTFRCYIASITDPSADPGHDPETPRPSDGRTPETAWTVTEALSMDIEFSREWVRGYIVGSYPHQYSMAEMPVFGTENASDHSIVLADTPECRDESACLRVINMQGVVKIDLNLRDNPEKLGEYVAVLGALSSEYKSMQMPADFCYLDPPAGVAVTPADTTDMPVEYYTVTGVRISADRLQPGTLYIRRNGSCAEKFIAK